MNQTLKKTYTDSVSSRINKLLAAYRASQGSAKELKIMNFYNEHRPLDKSPEEIIEMINAHKNTKCEVCNGSCSHTLEELSLEIYNFQYQKYISQQHIYEWLLDLYITKSHMGIRMEKAMINIIKRDYEHIGVRGATSNEDNNYAVDVVFGDKKQPMKIHAYIQVKPKSYLYTSQRTKNINLKKNSLLPQKVFYVYYNSKTETLLDNPELKEFLKAKNKPSEDISISGI